MAYQRCGTGTVLFLQSNSSPLVGRVQRRLRTLGVRTLSVAFCAGDRLWATKPVLSFRGRPDAWPAYLHEVIREHGVTDVVLFGKDRPLHAAAIEVARKVGVRAHALDEGFMRPNWITMEDVTASGGEVIPKFRRPMAEILPPRAPTVPIGTSFRRRASWDAAFHAVNIVLRPLYPFYRSHRRGSQVREGLGHLRKGLMRRRRRREARGVEEWIRTGARYFLFPMQLDNDFQIRRHSPFANMAEVLDLVFSSFSARARDDVSLVVKLHPLDAHVTDYRTVVRELSRHHGIEDRVVYVDGGDLRPMIENSLGVLTVNSTAGLWALRLGRPVKALAKPLYDRPGLTDPKPLGDFWSDPRPPDAQAVTWFVDHMRAFMQVNGGYFTDEGIALAVEGITRRLLEARGLARAPHHEARVDAAECEGVG